MSTSVGVGSSSLLRAEQGPPRTERACLRLTDTCAHSTGGLDGDDRLELHALDDRHRVAYVDLVAGRHGYRHDDTRHRRADDAAVISHEKVGGAVDLDVVMRVLWSSTPHGTRVRRSPFGSRICPCGGGRRRRGRRRGVLGSGSVRCATHRARSGSRDGGGRPAATCCPPPAGARVDPRRRSWRGRPSARCRSSRSRRPAGPAPRSGGSAETRPSAEFDRRGRQPVEQDPSVGGATLDHHDGLGPVLVAAARPLRPGRAPTR